MKVLWIEGGDLASRDLPETLRAGGCCVHRLADLLGLGEALDRLDVDVVVLRLERLELEQLGSLACVARRLPVVVLVERRDGASLEAVLDAGVSAYVVGGTERVLSVLEVASARFAQQQKLRGELVGARQELVERRLIERAKGALMQRRGLSESDAYHVMRKLAMDRSCRIAEVASQLLEGEGSGRFD